MASSSFELQRQLKQLTFHLSATQEDSQTRDDIQREIQHVSATLANSLIRPRPRRIQKG